MIEEMKKDRPGGIITCVFCDNLDVICIEYRGMKVFFDVVEDAAEFIELIKRSK